MYLPTVVSDNARLTPLSKEAGKRISFGKVKSILRNRTRQMTKEEEQAQREMFFSKLHDVTQTIGIHNFQGLTGGHILQQKR